MAECSFALCRREGRRADVPIPEIAQLLPLCNRHTATVRDAHTDPRYRVRWDLDPYGPGLVWIADATLPARRAWE
jgi:hypothetical protein